MSPQANKLKAVFNILMFGAAALIFVFDKGQLGSLLQHSFDKFSQGDFTLGLFFAPLIYWPLLSAAFVFFLFIKVFLTHDEKQGDAPQVKSSLRLQFVAAIALGVVLLVQSILFSGKNLSRISATSLWISVMSETTIMWLYFLVLLSFLAFVFLRKTADARDAHSVPEPARGSLEGMRVKALFNALIAVLLLFGMFAIRSSDFSLWPKLLVVCFAGGFVAFSSWNVVKAVRNNTAGAVYRDLKRIVNIQLIGSILSLGMLVVIGMFLFGKGEGMGILMWFAFATPPYLLGLLCIVASFFVYAHSLDDQKRRILMRCAAGGLIVIWMVSGVTSYAYFKMLEQEDLKRHPAGNPASLNSLSKSQAKDPASVRDEMRRMALMEIREDINILTDAAFLPERKKLKLSCIAGFVYRSTKGSTAADGSGWLPINFASVFPDKNLPIDPVNIPPHEYRFAYDPAANTYELNAVFERTDGDALRMMREDGGTDENVYEIGTDPGLDLIP